jgi:hypothetical protein
MGQQDMLARLLRGNPDPSLPGYPVMQSSEDRGFAPMPRSFADAGARMAAVLRGDVEPTPEDGRQIATVRGFTEGPASIRAFHGSPHRFDRFDMSRIGTGEGAQAYGHGLYFAGNEDVAKGYRDALSGVPPQFADLNFGGRASQIRARRALEDAIKSGLKGDDALASAMQALSKEGDLASSSFVRQANYDAVNALAPLRGKPLEINPGAMYEVNLNTTPDRLLDWDAPLSGQSPQVRAAIETVSPSTMRYMETIPGKAGDNGGFILSDIAEQIAGNRKAGAVEAASRLREAGIPGIQYLDAGSRAAGEGSRNYVMFDDKLIDILRRYGIAGTLGGGAAATSGTSE